MSDDICFELGVMARGIAGNADEGDAHSEVLLLRKTIAALASLRASREELLLACEAWEHWYSVDSSEFNREMARANGLKAIAKACGL